jgi:aminodeoxyfutalosine synthase
VTPLAREVCITGIPDTAAVASSAVRSARAVAGNRTVCGFRWSDIERLAEGAAERAALLAELRREGLDAVAELPLDATADITAAVEQLCAAGFEQIRLTVDAGGSASGPELWLRAAALQEACNRIQVLNPLPTVLKAFRPTTGYEDVRSVAIARLAAPNVPVIQVDWTRYGPKLAQVALTFGADDLWGVSASDEAPEGRRRAPREEIRRNIEAAGFEPVERDGRFTATV